MRIYLASSWKNKKNVNAIAQELRKLGFSDVYDFTDPEHFVFNMTEETDKLRDEVDWIECGQLIATQLACDTDKAGLDWSDVCILIHPCGNSAHMEAGYAVGAGKKLIVYGDLPRGRFEVQYNLTPHRFTLEQWNDLLAVLYQTEIDLKRETSRLIMERGLS